MRKSFNFVEIFFPFASVFYKPNFESLFQFVEKKQKKYFGLENILDAFDIRKKNPKFWCLFLKKKFRRNCHFFHKIWFFIKIYDGLEKLELRM